MEHLSNQEKLNSETQNSTTAPQRGIFNFKGKEKDFLLISLYNLLLTVITLGLYYPWAKAAIRKFLWQETELEGSNFEWHGTGKEMFKGFIKVYIYMILFLGTVQFAPLFVAPEKVPFLILGFYAITIALIPLAIHGMMRYRMSRTSYRGIHFGYRGDLKKLYAITSRDFLFTILTFGIYGSWMRVNARKYVMSHAKVGNVEVAYEGSGGTYFGLQLGQFFLVAITFYIYLPWAIIKLINYDINNSYFIQNGKKFYLKSTATGGGFFWVLIKGALLTVITLGLAGPIAKMWRIQYMIEAISIDPGFDYTAITQSEESYNDATGDDFVDVLDIGI